MLFRETVAVYCENHTEHTDTLCEQNAGFYPVKVGTDWSLLYLQQPAIGPYLKSVKFSPYRH
jgi:hypothetical protein